MTTTAARRSVHWWLVASLAVAGCSASYRLPDDDGGLPVDAVSPRCTTAADCTIGETCAAGTCACARGSMRCDGRCADLMSDPAHCGACGNHVGAACTSGVGPCVRAGISSSCVRGTLTCDAVAGSPTIETCNGIDDDCDGLIDDGVTAGVSCTVGVGACARFGALSCVERTCDAVAAAPNPETCNGIDDDCNGLVDDDVPAGASCSVGIGACARFGTLSCIDGTCDAVAASPGIERCNGIDDDCNGAIDDGVTCDVVELSAGGMHTCARRSSGDVVCWGSNDYGQLGDGTTTRRSAPTLVLGLTDAVELSAGGMHTCARRSSGEVVCWGYNGAGQLGDGTTDNRLTPTVVSSLPDAVELSAGGSHTCARRSSGELVCWGFNAFGEIGDGTTAPRSLPTAVSGLTDAIEVSAGHFHTCARTGGGGVVCWGRNGQGRLGDGTVTNRPTPTAVSGLTDAVEITAGEYETCARRVSGAVVCWGANTVGQLGDGTTTDRLTPTSVFGLADAVELSKGGLHTCARRTSGAIVCWGGNPTGALGDGTTTSRLTPTAVDGVTDSVEISAGGFWDGLANAGHTCARRGGGAVLCWGANFYGELGDGTMMVRSTPTLVLGL